MIRSLVQPRPLLRLSLAARLREVLVVPRVLPRAAGPTGADALQAACSLAAVVQLRAALALAGVSVARVHVGRGRAAEGVLCRRGRAGLGVAGRGAVERLPRHLVDRVRFEGA